MPRAHADIIPDGARGHAFIEVSDLTGEHITEEQYRELLSEYIIVSFEKIEPHDRYDSAGEKAKPTWAKCTRRRMPNVDNAKAREEIQRLNLKDKEVKDKSMSLLEKQQSLGQNAQDQITRMGCDLSAEEADPSRFHTVLEQISWTQRPIADGDKRFSKKHSSSKKKSHAKTKYERATITAYFKRCPRPDQLASELYHRLELERREKQELLERQQRDRDVMQMEIRKEEAHLKRIREERLREQERGHGQQQMHPDQQLAPNQRMVPNQQMPADQQMLPGQQIPLGQQRQAGQQMPPGRPFNATQMPPQQGHQMHQSAHAGQVPSQGTRPPNGQALPPGVRIMPTTTTTTNKNNGQTLPPPQMKGGDALGKGHEQSHGAQPSKRPTRPICVIHEPDRRRPKARRRGRASRSPSPSSAGGSSRSSTTLFSDLGSSSSSSSSDAGSDSEHSTTITEPEAAWSGSGSGPRRVIKVHQHHHHHHRKNPTRGGSSSSKPHAPRYATEPANFGERRATRRHGVDARAAPDMVFLVTGKGRRVRLPAVAAGEVPKVAGAASIPVVDDTLARIREAYRLGRADQRAEAETEVVEELSSGVRHHHHQAAPPAPRHYEGRRSPVRPEIHQQERDWDRDQLPRIRRAVRSEFEYQRERDLREDFAGLQVGREGRVEEDHDGWRRAQRRREARAIDEQEEIMREMEEDEERELRKQEERLSFRHPLRFMPQGRSGGLSGRS